MLYSPFIKSRYSFLVILLTLACIIVFTDHAWSQQFPNNFAGQQLATGLDPVGMDVAPDGRIFIAEKDGKIQIIKNGSMLSTPFASIPNVDIEGERGLMKVLLDPDFDNNQYLYIYYTRDFGSYSRNRISRITANGDLMEPGSELLLLEMGNLGSSFFHNGGGLAMKDGQLYISTGENTIANYSQSLENLKGKILRINTDGTIPTDNPFYTTASGKNRAIWALGFRNPFRLNAQPGTGVLIATDVGAGSWEEINEIEKGKNYGWPLIEGMRNDGQSAPENYQDPLYAYDHSQGCSITAGSFYNPITAKFPTSYIGKFFFGDYCNDWIRTFDPATGAVANFATNVNRPLDLAVSDEGDLYFISRGEGGNSSSTGGTVWRVNYTGNGAPVIAVQPQSQTISNGQSVTFEVQASGNPTPSFQWRRNGVNIPGATSYSYTLTEPTLSDNGANFSVAVSNSAGSVTSNSATLTVLDNDLPVATINTPTMGITYNAGDVITYSGSATDTEDGNLLASAFTWRIDLFHFDAPQHSHPAMDPTSGFTSGTFTVPTEMETSPNVLFRIFLTVVDSDGALHTVSRDITPILSEITLTTNPAGLNLKLDGKVVTTPYTFTGASGVSREIEAVTPQSLNGQSYIFSSWSDNGARTHTIATPATATTFTANFTEGSSGIVDGGIYEMQPQHNTDLRLTVRNGSTANSALVDGVTSNGSTSQQWKFIAAGNGLYEVEPQHSLGKRLDLAGSSTANNAEIHSYQRNGNNNQLWTAIDLGNEIYQFEPIPAPGKRLDIENVNGVPRALSRTEDGGQSQRWKLLPVSIPTCDIIPYSQVNGAAWTGASSVTLEVGDDVKFGPQSAEFGVNGNNWSWTGPNNYTASGRETLISNVQGNNAGTYTVTNVDANGCTATYDFTVIVNLPVNISIEAVEAEQTGNVATNLLDGNTDDASRWSANGIPKWVIFDLGVTASITGVKIWTYQDRAYQYTVEVSDSPTSGFSVVSDQTGNTNNTQPLTTNFSAIGRYVRLTVTGASGYSGTWVSLTELEIETANSANIHHNHARLSGEDDLENTLTVYPNPVDEAINISIKGIEKANVLIYNNEGQLLMSEEYSGGTLNISTKETLSKGLYLLKIISDDGTTQSRKLIIE